MSTEENKKTGITRREFVKGAAMVTGAGLIAGCTPMVAATPAATTAPTTPSGSTGTAGTVTSGQKWSFETPPTPIADADIANTVTTEVVVVGAGTAGLVCANSAAENGAKVVLISASKGNISRGGSNHAMYSKVMKAANITPVDTGQYFKTQLACAGYNVDQDKWWKFAKYSEEAMNWLIDKMEAAGYKTVLEIGNTDINHGIMEMPVGSHSWIGKDIKASGGGQQLVVDTLATTAQTSGVQIIYQTVAEQLVRENNNTGRVSAVIAKGADGKYTKYVGSKAIVLATGDFSADTEMMTRYCPQSLPLLNTTGDQGYDTALKMGGLYKGDGHKMGLWVGAAWQRAPNAPMIMGGAGPSTQPYGAHRGLLINKNGYRYGNEDCNMPFAGLSQMHQPDMTSYAIWGTNYAAAGAPWYSFGMMYGDPPMATADVIASWESGVKTKTMVKADTIEGVISALGLPADATKVTIDRYNGFCKSGVDEDFFKRKELLIPIDTGPFYGATSTGATLLTVCGGLRTNINMQVCDEKDQPIAGLYNLGIMVGDYFANIYNFLVEGNNLGANCVTFPYLTGKDIAKGSG